MRKSLPSPGDLFPRYPACSFRQEMSFLLVGDYHDAAGKKCAVYENALVDKEKRVYPDSHEEVLPHSMCPLLPKHTAVSCSRLFFRHDNPLARSGDTS